MNGTRLNISTFKPQQKWIGYIGFLSLLLFTISVFSARGLNRPIEVLFILTILFSLKPICIYEKENKGLWIYLLILLSTFLIFVSNTLATITYPTLDVNHSSDSLDFVRMLFFVFVGWWVVKKPKTVWLLLTFLSIAFAVKVVSSNQFLIILSSLNFPRADFGFSNAQHSAAFSGSLLITYISLSPLILRIKKPYLKAFAGALTLALLSLALLATLTSQTRAVWLGFFIVAGIAIMPWLILFIGQKDPRIKIKLLLFFTFSLITLIVVASLSSTISKKVKYTTDHILQLSQLKIEDMPTTSIGIRLHQWNLALDLIKERPISGHGGGSAKYLISTSDMPKGAITSFGHFHNSYLELGVAHGVGATILFIFILSFLAYRLIKAYRDNNIGLEFFFWGISWIVFFGIINIFESYVGSRTGYVLMIIFGGIIYGVTSKPYSEITKRERIATQL